MAAQQCTALKPAPLACRRGRRAAAPRPPSRQLRPVAAQPAAEDPRAAAPLPQRAWRAVLSVLLALPLVGLQPLSRALHFASAPAPAACNSPCAHPPQALAPPALPALAGTGDFTIEQRGATAQEELEEQYFQTVPQDLEAADTKTGPRLGALIEGPKGKQVPATEWSGGGWCASDC